MGICFCSFGSCGELNLLKFKPPAWAYFYASYLEDPSLSDNGSPTFARAACSRVTSFSFISVEKTSLF